MDTANTLLGKGGKAYIFIEFTHYIPNPNGKVDWV
jgi:hypothetical protein